MIKEILLEIDGKEIKMTVEQARALHDSLATLFAVKKTEYVPYYWTGYYPSVQPFAQPQWNPGTIICGDLTGDASTSTAHLDNLNSTFTLTHNGSQVTL